MYRDWGSGTGERRPHVGACGAALFVIPLAKGRGKKVRKL